MNDETMNILIIGAGGREHALAWAVRRSPLAGQVFVAPGNGGTALEAGVTNVPIASDDLEGLLAFAKEHTIDLTIVGPEAPLVAGIVDRFTAAGQRIFGPTQAAAQLEGSKQFTKDFLTRHGIPTAAYQSFTALDPALEYLANCALPVVIKADGLAAGKGVVIAQDAATAQQTVRDMLAGGALGAAGAKIVIEDYLSGEEASFIALVDGEQLVPLASSQDHKARDDGDSGPNTGGMGAYSPAPVISPALHERVLREVMQPTLAGLAAEGIHYRGFLYAGLMIGTDGVPRGLEYNCRLGDPETQPILLRLHSDLLALCLAAMEGRLDQVSVDWDSRPALGVVMAAQGYPGSYRRGDPITGLEHITDPDCKVFHAGTRDTAQGELVTHGGRVLCVTALGEDIAAAQVRAYAAVAQIQFAGAFQRGDIGYRALQHRSGI